MDRIGQGGRRVKARRKKKRKRKRRKDSVVLTRRGKVFTPFLEMKMQKHIGNHAFEYPMFLKPFRNKTHKRKQGFVLFVLFCFALLCFLLFITLGCFILRTTP